MKPVKTKASENYLSGDLYFAASTLFRQVNRLAIKAYKPAGLSPSLAHILMRLLENHYNFPSFVASHLWLSRSTVTRLTQKLEKMGLVTITHFENLADLSPTDKAWELEPILNKCQENFYQRCYRLVGREQYEMMTKILTGLTDGLVGRS
ncbi:MAG TPA: MarR family winged helix-turn-helix transcriptional regulator [Puia sp.]|jgi:DNA-binding MarR family transcriptional regulator|nr:MarR family winged helix-turn-helix transcriptional regulator [Puia sp.]